MKKTVLGWKEHIDFPDWNIKRVIAKIDTGAKTTSIHATNINIIGNKWVEFCIVGSKKIHAKRKIIKAKLSRISKVKSSNWTMEKRVCIKTHIKIGKKKKSIEVNLVDRDNMIYRVLLGRNVLSSGYVIDPGHIFLLSKHRRKRT